MDKQKFACIHFIQFYRNFAAHFEEGKKMDNSVTKKRAQSNEIDMLNGPLFKKFAVCPSAGSQQFVTGTF